MFPRLFLVIVAFCATVHAQTGTPSPFIGSTWSGNVTPTSATVVTRVSGTGMRVRVAVSVNANLSGAVFSSAVNSAAGTGNTVKLTVQGLRPDTDYYYGIEVNNVLRTEEESRGRFRTFPLGRGSFKIAFAGDGDFRHADQRAFDAILAERPLLFIHTGDFHYSDTNTTNVEDYRRNYDAVLSNRNQAALYRSIPVAYMWDDHDYCGDNTDGTAAGRDTARTAYKERVPHYPIASAGGAIAQAFTVGRVRVIMTDLRSASNAPTLKESASKTRMGTAQKTWFKQELISARDSGFPLILWVCTGPWISAPKVGDDTWGGYATERVEIANFIRDNRITNLTILGADMHALAVDDGTNSDYATGGGAPITVLHAAALTASGSIKGGPYSGGVVPGSGQYGILEVYDTGGPSVACRFLGKRVGEEPKLTHIFSSSIAGANSHALVNISTLARVTSATDSVVSGFVISGTEPRTVLVRAIGPTLRAFGVDDALARPELTVFSGNSVVATNNRWAPTEEAAVLLTTSFDRAGAFRLLDESSNDAALLVTLQPGPYTVQVKSADGQPGAALIEVYDSP